MNTPEPGTTRSTDHESDASDAPTKIGAPASHLAAPSDRSGRPAEVRVSTIVGDRLCIACGFNLTGQAVFKEPHYGLFIARCPECGVVAALQEYPLLGKWANRWAAYAAALWLAILLGGALGAAMFTFGLSMGSVQIGADRYADFIAMRAGETSHSPNFASMSGAAIRYDAVDLTWWDSQSQWALLADAGGFRRVVASQIVGFWIGLAGAGLIVGIIGSVALLHAKRLRAAAIMALPVVIAAIIQTSVYTNARIDLSGSLTASAHDVARIALEPVIFAFADGSMYLGIFLGVMVGRPVARALTRALLPPRLRSSLSFLWLADGKPPPKP